MSDPNLIPQPENETPAQSTPLRCLLGATVSGGLGYAMYSLMIAIATNFAAKPIHSDNQLVIRITSAIRTLVVGVVALGAGICGIIAIGLLALGVQLLLQKWTKPREN
ncbi:DUF3082 domain-containing protein [Fortiea contorta]|uniref:DUF3082 domain-containing protein n=1 Tax=Fortiea contorta TaxID=1892405 RepID=UPI00035D3046|nr:DUF3082 domain-containing protein [Fortiea contorta]